MEDVYSKYEDKYSSWSGYMMDLLERYAVWVQYGMRRRRSTKKGFSPLWNFRSFREFIPSGPYFEIFFPWLLRMAFPKVQNLHYLKVNLTDELARMIYNISTTRDNFLWAWNTLVERYDNRRMLVKTYLDLFFGLKVLIRENAADLRALVNTCGIIRLLESMNRLTDQWDDLLVYMTVQGNTEEKVRNFSSTRSALWKQWMVEIALIHCKETSAGFKSGKPGLQTQGYNASLGEGSCKLCFGKHHVIYYSQNRTKPVT